MAQLSACSSIPLSTAARLSQFNRDTAQALRPAEVALRVSVPRGFVIDPAKTYLAIGLQQHDEAAMRDFMLDLRLAHSGPGARSAGLLRGEVATTDFELVLNDHGRRKFREVQDRIARWQGGRTALNAGTDFSSRPEGASTVTLWIDLRLSNQDGFFPLIDGARVRLDGD